MKPQQSQKMKPQPNKKCTCDVDSPFMWAHNRRPSIFALDRSFVPQGSNGMTKGQLMTQAVDTQRARGIEPSMLYGLSKRSDERLNEQRRFINLQPKDSK